MAVDAMGPISFMVKTTLQTEYYGKAKDWS